ncbi:M23 family metallopeptidase [Oricola sp.]|uniref:M23 family metallopeptidase n=1 Tax=Oricola sp. TaxID=1979950 RepID=UPI003BAAC1DF
MVTSQPANQTSPKIELGNEPPMLGSDRKSLPDRREVSLRWLSGTALTGLTSTILMSAALFAALDGRELLAVPAEVATSDQLSIYDENEIAEKGPRVFIPASLKAELSDRRRMDVSMITRVGDSDVIRTKPFEHVHIALAAGHNTDKDYPAFNPLNIFSDGSEPEPLEDDTQSIIYGANVETEVEVRFASFDFDEEIPEDPLALSDAEAEEIVRETAAILTDGTVQLASLHYIDPFRFGISDPSLVTGLGLATAAKVVPENMSVAARAANNRSEPGFAAFDEDLIELNDAGEIGVLLAETGYGKASNMATALETLLQAKSLKSGHAIRLGLQATEDGADIVRASVYSGANHQLTIALNDRRQYVPAPEPVDPGVMRRRDGELGAPVVANREMPSAYDAIYRSVLSYDLPDTMAADIVRMVAADVDFRSAIRPTDRIELFFALPEDEAAAPDGHELLFVEASFGGSARTYYRFRSSDGVADYYDREGRSARQFLLRNPVPNGVFRSPFGKRKHPILGYVRMHWGVDWAAPRGTPIIAPGNGVVTKAGWASGYGKQIVLRHANGYETSYSHQSKFAKGIGKGVKVRQGQIIGYIGTTGLSTGPHLHYEMKVNGNRVDPMRVRLPKGRVLEGEELKAFARERDRINALLGKSLEDDGTVVAQVAG